MMGDSMTVLVALLALCVVNMVLIWQVATLADEVHDFDDDMRATLMWGSSPLVRGAHLRTCVILA